MNARFLREEAARIRDMAASTDREASQVRLLTMAAECEARAETAQGAVEPPSADAPAAPAEPGRSDVLKLKPSRRGIGATKSPVVADVP